MPINAASTLLQLSPIRPIDFGGGDDPYGLDKLKLMQEQFAETKRRNQVDEELRRMEEAGAARRQEMQLQQQREKAAAEAAAQQEAQKRALMGEFQKYRDAGDVEGIHGLVPAMQAAGMNMDYLGEDEYGLPSFQIDWNGPEAQQQEAQRMAQASPYGEEAPAGAYGSMEEAYGAPPAGESAAQSLDRLGALGYPGLDRGTLDEGGISGSDQLDASGQSVADRVAATYGTPGDKLPTRGPDAPDIMGGVPKNVIDFGAQQESIRRRLDPALGALQRAYPDRMQESVGETNAAAAAMGLPATKGLELAKSLRAGPDAAMNQQFQDEQEAAKQQAAREPKPLTRKDVALLAKDGEAYAKETFDNQDISGVFTRSKAAASIVQVLTDDRPGNDLAIAFELPNMLGSKGAQSNKDLAVALGLDAMSTVDQIVDRVTNIIKGGFSDLRKEDLLSIINDRVAKDDNLVYDFLDAIEESASTTQDPDTARGLRAYAARNVPKKYRDAWLEDKGIDPETQGGAQYDPTDVDEEADPAEAEPDADMDDAGEPNDAEPDADPDDVDRELARQAKAAGLDVKQLRPLVSTESGGDPSAVNRMGSSASGIFQFTDETAKAYGLKNAAEYRALPAKKQIELGIRRFKALGLDAKSTRDDYAIANAAPAYVGRPDDTEIKQYRSGTKRGDKVRQQNPGWIPADGGEITVGSIKAFYRGGEKKPAAKKAPDSPALKLQKEREAKRKGASTADDDMLRDLGEQ